LLDDVCCLEPFRTLDDIELHIVAIGESFEAITLDSGIMNENIIAAVVLNEPEAFSLVKPLYGTFCQLKSPPLQ